MQILYEILVTNSRWLVYWLFSRLTVYDLHKLSVAELVHVYTHAAGAGLFF